MKFFLSRRAVNDYDKLPERLKKIADKQFGFLLLNFKHSSLRTKKYDEAGDIWQGRVDRKYRFYFQIRGDAYYIIAIVKHPK